MTKFLRNTRQQLLTDNQFKKYTLYAAGEIALIVIGILIALQIDNWNTERIKKQDEKQTYENIRRQIVDDLNELAKVKDFHL